MDYKTFTIELDIKALKKGEGRAVIAELNKVDHDNDVTLPGAFGKQHVNVLPAHDRMAPRLGKGILTESGGKAVADFKFNLSPEAVTAKEWHSALLFDMENGEPLQEWSYGFKVVDYSFGEFEGKQVRFLKSLEVIEISPVLKGAGIGTATLAIKDNKGMTFKDQMEKAIASLGDVKDFIERSKSLADLKAKDGKYLSDEQVETLTNFVAFLGEAKNNCQDILTQMDKDSTDTEALQELLGKCQVTLFKVKHFEGVG